MAHFEIFSNSQGIQAEFVTKISSPAGVGPLDSKCFFIALTIENNLTVRCAELDGRIAAAAIHES
jgi:hypothetical protein